MPNTMKSAAKRIQDAYEQKYLKADQKKVKVSNKADEDGRIQLIVQGPKSEIDSVYERLNVMTFTLDTPLDGIHIHSARAETKEGPATDKAEEQTSTLTIHLQISNY